jgi:hypothetical protein
MVYLVIVLSFLAACALALVLWGVFHVSAQAEREAEGTQPQKGKRQHPPLARP